MTIFSHVGPWRRLVYTNYKAANIPDRLRTMTEIENEALARCISLIAASMGTNIGMGINFKKITLPVRSLRREAST